MAEPEELLIEAAHHGVVQIAALRERWTKKDSAAGLDSSRRRLELFIAAVCPGAPPLAIAEPPAIPTWLGRWVDPPPPSRAAYRAQPSTDGTRIRLPATLEGPDACADVGETAQVYRVLALMQAIHAARGAPRWITRVSGRAERDAFELAEAAAAESRLVEIAPGLVTLLRQMRRRMREQRPDEKALEVGERFVEALVRDRLDREPYSLDSQVPVFETPRESFEWAGSIAREMRGRYRGVAQVFLWGRIDAAPEDRRVLVNSSDLAPPPPSPPRSAMMRRRPRPRTASPGEQDERSSLAMIPTEDRQEAIEDPLGLTRPVDRDPTPETHDLADALAELPEALMVSTPERAREVLAGSDPLDPRSHRPPGTHRSGEWVYPEWDTRTGNYRQHGATVHVLPREAGSSQWADSFLAAHRPLVRAVRRRFERLRIRRIHLTRQTAGSELDITAYADAFADMRSGGPVDDRFYLDQRPLRRECAILLLVDASASTDAWVDARSRVIDVEKEALLLVNEALETLGDRFTILSFSGEGPHGVRLRVLRDASERNGSAARRAIAGLEPDGYTRMGAALRHAAHVLGTERAAHRLLLVLSDGKPNDVDEYEGRYGVEDSRRAVLEARADGMTVFCMTVDREAPRYLPRVFGPTGYVMLRHAAGLPAATLHLLRRLVVH